MLIVKCQRGDEIVLTHQGLDMTIRVNKLTQRLVTVGINAPMVVAIKKVVASPGSTKKRRTERN